MPLFDLFRQSQPKKYSAEDALEKLQKQINKPCTQKNIATEWQTIHTNLTNLLTESCSADQQNMIDAQMVNEADDQDLNTIHSAFRQAICAITQATIHLHKNVYSPPRKSSKPHANDQDITQAALCRYQEQTQTALNNFTQATASQCSHATQNSYLAVCLVGAAITIAMAVLFHPACLALLIIPLVCAGIIICQQQCTIETYSKKLSDKLSNIVEQANNIVNQTNQIANQAKNTTRPSPAPASPKQKQPSWRLWGRQKHSALTQDISTHNYQARRRK